VNERKRDTISDLEKSENSTLNNKSDTTEVQSRKQQRAKQSKQTKLRGKKPKLLDDSPSVTNATDAEKLGPETLIDKVLISSDAKASNEAMERKKFPTKKSDNKVVEADTNHPLELSSLLTVAGAVRENSFINKGKQLSTEAALTS
jgi:hypothetical protein